MKLGIKIALGLLLLSGCSSGASSSATSSSSSSSSSSGSSTCSASAADGIAVAASDVYGGLPYALGYPPYAVDRCRLVFVAPDGSLHRRDLGTGTEVEVAPASESPRRPAVAGELLAYESTMGGVTLVRVREGDAPARTVLPAGYDHTGEPRATDDAVVFTAWRAADDTSDTDVALYLAGGTIESVSKAPAQQRFADVSADYVAFTDFTEDPTGAFHEDASIADITVFDRHSKTLTTRKKPGKQAFPTIGDGGKIAYLDWGLVHPEPKFSEYDLVVGGVQASTAADAKAAHVVTTAPYVRPTARGALLDWVDWELGASPALTRRKTDLSDPPAVVLTTQSAMYGPAVTANMTVVAIQDGSAVVLKGAAR